MALPRGSGMAELIHYSNPQSRSMRTQILLDCYDKHLTEVGPKLRA